MMHSLMLRSCRFSLVLLLFESLCSAQHAQVPHSTSQQETCIHKVEITQTQKRCCDVLVDSFRQVDKQMFNGLHTATTLHVLRYLYTRGQSLHANASIPQDNQSYLPAACLRSAENRSLLKVAQASHLHAHFAQQLGGITALLEQAARALRFNSEGQLVLQHQLCIVRFQQGHTCSAALHDPKTITLRQLL